jgi:hypothetical protein
MLLMTLGLVDVVSMAHPREWVMFLDRDQHQEVVRREAGSLMRQAKYDTHDYGLGEISCRDEIPRLPARSGWGETFAECRSDLTTTVEDWVFLNAALREPFLAEEE